MSEKIEKVKDPRNAAIDFVTSGGKYTLKVDGWLDAGPPSGGGSEFAYATGVSVFRFLADAVAYSIGFFPFSFFKPTCVLVSYSSNLSPSQYTTANGVHYANAKKGVYGKVAQTGQSFTIRDDYDFANPGVSGKGYHVNTQLGKEKVAFCYNGHSTPATYHDRTKMTGERYYFDGPEEAANWYTTKNT
jgi:hypothetical protein